MMQRIRDDFNVLACTHNLFSIVGGGDCSGLVVENTELTREKVWVQYYLRRVVSLIKTI